MKNRRHLSGTPLAFASILFATMFLFLAACEQSQQSTSSSPKGAAPQVASTEKIFVEFQGPWAFATDPKDANRVIAIAPKAKGHHDLFVKASNDATLAAGIYDLALPAQPGAAGTIDSAIAQVKVTPAGLQQALDAKGARYAIRLPKPDAYIPAGRAKSRLGASYPPDAATEKDYTTGVSLRYTVGSVAGVSLVGTLDTGTFNPLLLQVDTPVVRFVIEPAQLDDPFDHCETHSRESFRDLVKLLGLTLYVDFPNYTGDCQKKDVQHPSKADMVPASRFDRIAALLTTNLVDGHAQTASLAGGGVDPISLRFLAGKSRVGTRMHSLMSTIFLFAHSGLDCKAPILILVP